MYPGHGNGSDAGAVPLRDDGEKVSERTRTRTTARTAAMVRASKRTIVTA